MGRWARLTAPGPFSVDAGEQSCPGQLAPGRRGIRGKHPRCGATRSLAGTPADLRVWNSGEKSWNYAWRPRIGGRRTLPWLGERRTPRWSGTRIGPALQAPQLLDGGRRGLGCPDVSTRWWEGQRRENPEFGC